MRSLLHNPLFGVAHARWDEARALYDAGQFSGAVYLAGYTVELTLKAQIPENLGISTSYNPGNIPPIGPSLSKFMTWTVCCSIVAVCRTSNPEADGPSLPSWPCCPQSSWTC
jgi:hypothetical protein